MDKFNKMIREEIHAKIEDKQVKKGFSIKEAIKEYINEYYERFDSVGTVIKDNNTIYKNFFVGVIFVDAYKMYSYKVKVHLASDVEKDIYYNLYNFEDLTDILTEISANPALFEKMVESSYWFYNTDCEGKNMILDSLSESENAYLTEIFPPHQYDLEKREDLLNLDSIFKYFAIQKEYMEKVMSIEFDEAILNEVVGFIKYQFIVNRENVLTFLKSLIANDCRIICYLLKNEEIDVLKERLEFYSVSSIDEIIKRVCEDQDFLFDILHNYMDLLVNEKYAEYDISKDIELDNSEQEVLKKLL